MLYNTAWRLAHEKKLRIGYFGGSITCGAGASDNSRCYRSQLTEWFRKTYPDAEITEIHAAIGGTATDLGVYRCAHDLLSQKPELVIFEFAVNDCGKNYDNICMYTESIFRKIRRYDPTVEIITVITTTEGTCQKIAKGIDYASRTAHLALSQHFGIPSVDVGEALWNKVLADGGDFRKYAPDGVHPNDTGYAIYTECLLEQMTALLEKPGEQLIAYAIPRQFSEKLCENADLLDCAALPDYQSKGFTLVEESLCDQYPHYIEATVPGASFSFTFTGTDMGFYWMMAKDSGDVIVSIDDRKPFSSRSWDHYCRGFNRIGGHIVVRDLPATLHHVTVTVSDEKAEDSDGTAIRIGAIMIS